MARKKLYAAIDVGSHEIQMKIAELAKREPPKVIESIRRTLAIGTDTYTRGEISQPVLESCIEVLNGFIRDMDGYRIGEYRVLATSAFREASNQLYAIDQIARHCGLQVDILSNSEERYYHMMSTWSLMQDFPELIKDGTLIVDISAGSIQLTVYHKGEFIFSQNLLLGSLRIRELLADLERRTANLPALMDEYISIDLSTYHLHEPKGIVYKHLIITGHELAYLSKLADLEEGEVAQITEKSFDKIYHLLLKNKPLDLALDYDIPAEHASLLLPVAIIMRKLISYTKAKNIYLPRISLAEGVLVEYACNDKKYKLSHDSNQDLIAASRQLAKRFKTDKAHNEAVEQAVIQLFDETARLHRLDNRYKLVLRVAAILRDCGKYVNISRHHDRSFNIILATELIGLTAREQTIAAFIARYHGGNLELNDPEFARLMPEDQLVIAKLTALLRLADALDAGHQQKIRQMEFDFDRRKMVLIVTADQDLTLELWNIDQKAALFEQVYGYTVEIKRRKQNL